MGIVLSWNFRTAENVSFPSLNFTSLSFSSFWSGQFIVPARLSPSFLIVSSDVRCWSPILYSHFQVPTGSAFSPCATARPQNPSTNATERIVFMSASKKLSDKEEKVLSARTRWPRIERMLFQLKRKFKKMKSADSSHI